MTMAPPPGLPYYPPPQEPSKPRIGAKSVVVGVAAVVVLAVIATVTTVLLTRHSHSAAQACQQAVTSQLKAPATAKFPALPVRVETDTPGAPEYVGSVDSENGFSALVRSRFTCFMVTENGQLTVAEVDFPDENDN